MIAFLQGTVIRRHGNQLIVDAGQVGYAVQVLSLNDWGQEVQLWIACHYREQALELYGFASPEEKDVFELLLTISGVGPRVATGILATFGIDGLQRLVAQQNRKSLLAVPGVGKRSAEKIFIDLEAKAEWLGSVSVQPQSLRPEVSDKREMLESALSGLGLRTSEVARVVNQLDFSGDQPMTELIQQALRVRAGDQTCGALSE